MNTGSSTRLKYDNCSYMKDLFEATQPMSYQLYFGKHENVKKCVYKRFYTKPMLVDVE